MFERGIDICLETVRFWWNRFAPVFASEIRKRRIHRRSYSQWRWHLDEVFVSINGETHDLRRAVDHEGEVLEVFATKRRDRKTALKFLKRTMKRFGRPHSIITVRLWSYQWALTPDNSCNLDDRIASGHLLRRIDIFVAQALADIHDKLAVFYSHTGRPSIDTELMVRLLIAGYCCGIRSERRLCEEVSLNLAYRWFCNLGLEDGVPDHSSFSKNRHSRFRDSDLLRHVFERFVRGLPFQWVDQITEQPWPENIHV